MQKIFRRNISTTQKIQFLLNLNRNVYGTWAIPVLKLLICSSGASLKSLEMIENEIYLVPSSV
jgi:hypothetical protein